MWSVNLLISESKRDDHKKETAEGGEGKESEKANLFQIDLRIRTHPPLSNKVNDPFLSSRLRQIKPLR